MIPESRCQHVTPPAQPASHPPGSTDTDSDDPNKPSATRKGIATKVYSYPPTPSNLCTPPPPPSPLLSAPRPKSSHQPLEFPWGRLVVKTDGNHDNPEGINRRADDIATCCGAKAFWREKGGGCGVGGGGAAL